MRNGFAFIFLLAIRFGYAQDLVVTPEGDSINCKITQIKDEKIYFTFKHKGEVRHTIIALTEAKGFRYRYFTEAEVPPQAVKRVARNPFRSAISGGLGQRTAAIPAGYFGAQRTYLKDLKSGGQWSLSLVQFISEPLGVGILFNSYLSRASADNISIALPGGTSFTGSVSDRVRVMYFGPNVLTQWTMDKKKGALVSDLSLGFIRYDDVASLNGNIFNITGRTFGMAADFGYDIPLSKKIKLGFQLSMLVGTLSKVDVRNGASSTTVKFNKGEYEGLGRVDFSIGLRLLR
jgi:hypothetical protein